MGKSVFGSGGGKSWTDIRVSVDKSVLSSRDSARSAQAAIGKALGKPAAAVRQNAMAVGGKPGFTVGVDGNVSKASKLIKSVPGVKAVSERAMSYPERGKAAKPLGAAKVTKAQAPVENASRMPPAGMIRRSDGSLVKVSVPTKDGGDALRPNPSSRGNIGDASPAEAAAHYAKWGPNTEMKFNKSSDARGTDPSTTIRTNNRVTEAPAGSSTVAPGTVVKFANIVHPDDANRRMEVVEDRGDRVLVRTHPSDSVYRPQDYIQPTAVYSKSDLLKQSSIAAGGSVTGTSADLTASAERLAAERDRYKAAAKAAIKSGNDDDAGDAYDDMIEAGARLALLKSGGDVDKAVKLMRADRKTDKGYMAADDEQLREAIDYVSKSSIASDGEPGGAGTRNSSMRSGGGGGGDDQPRVPAGNPDGGQWTKL